MKKKPIDYPVLFITVLLVAIGLIMVFSASYYFNMIKKGDGLYLFKRQSMWAVLGFVCLTITSNIYYKRLEKLATPLVVLSIGLLGAVLIAGANINNATRWFYIGRVSIQPAEIAKFSLVIFLARYLSFFKDDIKSFTKGVLPNLIVMGIMFVLILLQPNFSTAGCLAIITFIMLFVGGAKIWQLIGLVGSGAIGAVILVMKASYRMKRFTTFLDPWADPTGDGYQVIHSLYALASGGIFGKGFAKSHEKHMFMPYPETDFIFAVIGEEWGLVGATVLIILFCILIWRGIRIAITAQDDFGTLLATGIVSIIAVQAIINIAVVTSSMPATGLPLPFISAGGTSLAVLLSAVGVLLNISKYCKTSKPKKK